MGQLKNCNLGELINMNMKVFLVLLLFGFLALTAGTKGDDTSRISKRSPRFNANQGPRTNVVNTNRSRGGWRTKRSPRFNANQGPRVNVGNTNRSRGGWRGKGSPIDTSFDTVMTIFSPM